MAGWVVGLVLAAGSSISLRAGDEGGPVSIQLKWYHQFQFAGYYAADLKGYFEAEGLDVEIVEGNPQRPPLDTVLGGRADFGVTDSDVLLARMEGRPVVVCAAIFQHSPYVLISLEQSGIRTPSDLIDRVTMVSGSQGSAQLLAMIKREGLPVERVKLVPHSWSLDDLIEGRVDVISGYATAEPSQLRAMGVTPYVMRTSDYGVDFYGDTLITREEVVEKRPADVDAMVRAVKRGWEYAMDHPDELIDHILTLPGVRERGIRRENLEFEAREMRPLIMPELVEVGHMNPGRWRWMSEAYQESGVAGAPSRVDWLDGFLYQTPPPAANLWTVGMIVAGFTLVSLAGLCWTLLLRRKVERRTREVRLGERKLHAILDNSSNLLGLLTAGGELVEVNRPALDFGRFRREQVLSRPFWETPFWSHDIELARTIREGIDAINRGENGIRLETTQANAAGEMRVIDFEMRPVPGIEGRVEFIVAEGIDITEQRRLGDDLRQSQKMQAIGQLAGGVAHDFNNLLTVIQGNACIMQCEDADRGRARHEVSEILKATERASSLTRQLLAFSRQQPLQSRKFLMNDCASAVTRMLERLIGEDIALETAFCEEPTPILADEGMVEQVLINLALNARDAMPAGGTLTLATKVVALAPGHSDLPVNEAPGDYVRIRVEDTGGGIPADLLPHIFEPFYTTKEVGKGTGLGLATVFGIVRQHQGWVSVRTKVGSGTTFDVWLPCAAPESRDAAGVEPVKVEGAAPRERGSETVLLVEDETMVRMIGQKVLSMHGYDVIEATSGRHALEVWEEHASRIDLLLTDIVMPEGVSGHDLAQRLQKEKPDLKVIYTSGYTAEVFLGDAVFPEGAAFIGKPYRPEELLAKLRSALDGVALSA